MEEDLSAKYGKNNICMEAFMWQITVVCFAAAIFFLLCGEIGCAIGCLIIWKLISLVYNKYQSRQKKGKRRSRNPIWLEKFSRECETSNRIQTMEYQEEMRMYHALMEEAKRAREAADRMDGYRRNDLLRQAQNLEYEAQKHYRSII